MKKRKVVNYALCTGLAVTMAVGQPAAVLASTETAAETEIQGNNEITEEEALDLINAYEETNTETEENKNESGVTETTEPSIEETTGTAETTEAEETVTEEETDDGIELFSVEAGDDINQKNEEGYYTVPTATMPTNLADGTYELPFRLFALPAVGGTFEDRYETIAPYDNYKYAQTSMGNATFATVDGKGMNYAVVTVENGAVRVMLKWNPSIGCYQFNWYEDYDGMKNKDKKGGYPGEEADNTNYEYKKDYPYENRVVDAITSMTFTPPSENPVVYISVKSAGMLDSEQNAFLGFYWDYLTPVDVPEPEVDTEAPTAPSNVEVSHITSTTATVSWEASTDNVGVEKYEVYNGTTLLASTTEETTAELKNLTADTAYKLSVYAYDEAGNKSEAGIVEFNTEADTGDQEEEPEIQDELVKKFLTLKSYVDSMSADEYFLKNNSYSTIIGSSGTNMSINKLYKSLKEWLILSESEIESNGGVIPEEDRDTFEETLLDWDAKLASPEYFGKIFSDTSVILPNRTYQVPVKYYNAVTTTAITPLGNEIEVKGIGEENEYLKDYLSSLKIDSNKVETTSDEIRITIGLPSRLKNEDGSTKASFSFSNCINPNIGTYSWTSITSYAAFREIYLDFGITEGNEKTTQSIVLVLDWENAVDITETEISPDKTTLQSYVSSINAMLEGDLTTGLATGWPQSVSEAAKECGIVDEAQAVLDNSEATYAEIVDMENRIQNFFDSYYTVKEAMASFPGVASKKNKDDYTKSSYTLYRQYADLAQEFAIAENWIEVYYPIGSAFDPDGNAWSKEEREIFALRNPSTGELFDTDAESEEVFYNILFNTFSSGSKVWHNQYNRFFELENALVSIKELKEAITAAEAYGEVSENYTSASYLALTDALEAASTTVADDDATAEEVAKAQSDLQEAVSALVSVVDLNAAITDAEAYKADSADYSIGSYKALTDAIAAAKRVANTADATAEEVADAQAAVEAAVQALVSIKDLNASIALAARYENQSSKYTAKTFEAFTTALEAAETAAEKSDVTAEEAAEAKANLDAAIVALKERADKTALAAAIKAAEIEAAKTDVYTEASLLIFQNTIAAAQEIYDRDSISQAQVDQAVEDLKAAQAELKLISSDDLDKDKLADGIYSVVVNLWHVEQDKESMGNAALYHNATLTVKDGKYTLTIKGHTMTVGSVTGELDQIQVVPDGSKPKSDGSNYVTLENVGSNGEYIFNMEIENVGELSDYYYSRIKVKEGTPMGTNWITSRLRISWDTLTILDVEEYPAFSATDSATGVKVEAPEGALPKGTKLRVTKVTDENRINEIDGIVSSLADKNTAYEITLYVVEDGKEVTVDPKDNMELSITLPVPEDYTTSKLACYYIDSSNYANALSGTLNGTNYSVVSGKLGTYVIAQKKTVGGNGTVVPNTNGSNNNGTSGTTTTRPTATLTSNGTTTKTSGTTTTKTTTTAKTSTAKTGDETNVALASFIMMIGASVMALLEVFRRRTR